jgi:hypothetical protein
MGAPASAAATRVSTRSEHRSIRGQMLRRISEDLGGQMLRRISEDLGGQMLRRISEDLGGQMLRRRRRPRRHARRHCHDSRLQ